MTLTAVRTSATAAAEQDPAHAYWLAVWSLAAGVFAMVTSEFLPAALLTPIAEDLQISEGIAGQAVSSTALMAIVAAFVVVLGLARLDRRFLILGLTLLLAASNALFALSNSTAALLIARLGVGAALGGTWTTAAAVSAKLVPERRVAIALTIVFGGISAATVFAPAVGTLLGEWVGWRATFLMAAALALSAAGLQMVSLPCLPAQRAVALGEFLAVVRRRPVKLGLWSVLLSISGHFAAYTYMRPFLSETQHLAANLIAAQFAVFGVAGVVGNLIGGSGAGRRPCLAFGAASLSLATAVALLAIVPSGSAVLSLATALWGVSFGALPIASQVWTTRAAADHAETGGAWLVVATQLAAMIGAVAGGMLHDVGSNVAPLGYAIIASISGGLLIIVRGPAALRMIDRGVPSEASSSEGR